MLLHNIYKRLPAPARSAAASVRGAYLQALRYGAETEAIVEEALDHESWSPERLAGWQQEQLARLLHRAATRVPYYRAYWAERRAKGDGTSCEYLENWPVLDKDAVREHGAAFVADDRDVRKMYRDHTSGSTGKPVTVWLTRECLRRLYGYFEARVRGWHGVTRHDRWAIAGGQLVTPVSRTKPPFWVWNAPGRQLYLSSYHLKPEYIPAYAEAIRRYRVQYIYGYTSSLFALAREMRDSGPVKLRVAMTNAEPLSEYQRNTIAEGFGCRVAETYGMCELAAFASECPDGAMHLWPEMGHVEALETGELVCSGLLNVDMPLIRYRVGDRGEGVAGGTCSCGKNLPLFGCVEGRIDDVLYAADGRAIGRLDPLFKGDLRLKEAQIVQEAFTRVLVRYVPDKGFGAREVERLVRGLHDRMGSVEVRLEPLREIPRGPNGKFRAVVCNLKPEERDELRRSAGRVAAKVD